MNNSLKNKVKKHQQLYKLLKLIQFILQCQWKKKYSIKYPEVLQFPITNVCNSNCVMCNVKSNISKNEMTVQEFEKIIGNEIFKQIKSVGINGGEPFLCKNLIHFIKILVRKKNIKSINIISNGFLTQLILSELREIYSICRNKGVELHISFSLDGYKNIHDKVRGVPNVFPKTVETITQVVNNKDIYCDSYDIGCTVVKQNVNYLVELEAFAKQYGWNIKFRLGIKNERLHNCSMYDSFNVLNDPVSRQTAKEFFFSQIFKAQSLYEQYKYWAIFTYLNGDEQRKLGCDWQDNGITLDSEGNIYYCAVESPCIANLKKCSGNEYFKFDNLAKRKKIINEKCSTCIHDYFGRLLLVNVIKFLKWKIFNKYWLKSY